MRARVPHTPAMIVALIVLAAASIAWAHGTRNERRFPHHLHEKLFPTCTGCHAGIITGLAATTFPAPETCASCHDGKDVKVIAWSGPSHTPSNLHFDHALHASKTLSAGDTLACLRCHGTGADVAARPWMVVRRAPPTECITCHAHRASAHLASDATCETCHVPLVRAVALSDSAVASFPKPPSHSAPDWISTHAPTSALELARCATCHARESCARCHVNAAALSQVTSLEPDPRVARLVHGLAPRYPVPASHLTASFATGHGALARKSIATCANCHAQSSCRSCHLERLAAREIGRLPRPLPTGAQGVQLRGSDPTFGPAPPRPDVAMPTRNDQPAAPVAAVDTTEWQAAVASGDTTRATLVHVHPAGFARAHGPAAASGQLDCAGCHQQRFCISCHQGGAERHYHPFNFVARHASEAYARETSCTSCHNAETFCRSCHEKSGLAGTATSRTLGAAHGAAPLWLLQHGQAARQGLQSCAGCHQQTDCMRCHSTVTQRVNPHGPDFDARRMAARNKIVCLYCHISDPLK